MAETDRALVRRRRGYWIKRARERHELTLDTLAEALGYAPGSGSVISRWESGERPVPSDRFPAIARILELPGKWLVNPPQTDDERLDEIARLAGEEKRRDWEPGPGRGPEAGDGPPDEPSRRSA